MPSFSDNESHLLVLFENRACMLSSPNSSNHSIILFRESDAIAVNQNCSLVCSIYIDKSSQRVEEASSPRNVGEQCFFAASVKFENCFCGKKIPACSCDPWCPAESRSKDLENHDIERARLQETDFKPKSK